STNFSLEDYTSEVRLTKKSSFIGRTVGDVEKLGGGDVDIIALIREAGRRQIPTRRWKLYADDVLVVEADPQVLEQFARDGNLELVGTEKAPPPPPANRPCRCQAAGAESENPGTGADAARRARTRRRRGGDRYRLGSHRT